MKRSRTLIIATAIILVAISLILYRVDQDSAPYPTTPETNQGEKWHIGYYEGGPYIDYTLHLRAVVGGLSKLGWIDAIHIPEYDDPEDARAIWAFLSNNVQSDYIEFVPDAYWSANWNDDTRQKNREKTIGRLATDRDIDVMLAMGTWAGQDLANNEHTVPTVVLSASDPVGAGIVKSAEYSGFDHVLARCDPEQYVTQVRLFHDIIGFQKLGVAYEDTPDGRLYANVPDLESVAAERGFELVACHAQDVGLSKDECREEIHRCYQKLAPHVDALWIGDHRGNSSEYLPELLEPLLEHGVPTWAVGGSDYVKQGVLMSVAHTDFSCVGRWAAEAIAMALNGARLGEQNQVCPHPNKVAINVETADRIGYEPPAGILEAADEIYERTEAAGDE